MSTKIDNDDSLDLDLDLDADPDTDREEIPDTLRSPAPSEIPPPPESGTRLRADVPDALRDGLHALMLAASQGDRHAIGSIAIAFLPNLLAIARSEVDRMTIAEEKSAAADIVAELLELMANGSLASRPPAKGESLEWMERMVRRFAHGHETADYGDDPPEEAPT